MPQTTRDIRVTVRSFYLEDQSRPDESHYVWAYRVRIENHGRETVQLLRRTWQITDARGRTQHVHGAGVVGEQPVLEPGRELRIHLRHAAGHAVRLHGRRLPHGGAASGEKFDVAIPAFSLDSPHQSGGCTNDLPGCDPRACRYPVAACQAFGAAPIAIPEGICALNIVTPAARSPRTTAPPTARPTREEAEAGGAHPAALGRRRPRRARGCSTRPRRVVRSYEEFFAGYDVDPVALLERTFEEIDGYDEMVLLRDIRLESHCEHHMVPIIGRAHVAYLPHRRVVGISKLARVVEAYAKRLQIQEKLTAQIANTIQRGAAAARRRRGDRGGASVHDHARRPQARRDDGDQPHARRLPRRPDDAAGVPGDDRQRVTLRRALGPVIN